MNKTYSVVNIIKYIFLALLIITCCTACENKSDYKSTDIQAQLLNIPSLLRWTKSVAVSKKDIIDQYGKADTTRDLNDYTYEIRNFSDSSKQFIFYDKGDIVSDSWRLKHLIDPKIFNKIKPGKSTYENVKEIDPYFKPFETTQNNKQIALSEHKLTDNGIMTVTYKKNNNKWIVESLEHSKDDPLKFVSKLLTEDKALLSNQ